MSVVKVRQPLLPEVDGVKRIKSPKFPQPRSAFFAEIKKFEILHRPFDLQFRGRIGRWLDGLFQKKEFEAAKAIGERENLILRLYFFPEGAKNIWLSQRDVIKRISGQKELFEGVNLNRKKLRKMMVFSLIVLWNETKKAKNI